jgi:hypothetical protein
MSVQYTNRRGDVYHLQEGKTKTGKPKYYFGKKLTGAPVDAIPEGYEIREDPDRGQVTLRKMRHSDISDMEMKMLVEAIRSRTQLEHFIVDIDGNSLVVYVADVDNYEVERLKVLSERFGVFGTKSEDLVRTVVTRSRYSPMMRFNLLDVDNRLYSADRWCFLGSIDDWYVLDGPAPLPKLMAKYVKHLGKESFYELM